jgi:hypothetical protein
MIAGVSIGPNFGIEKLSTRAVDQLRRPPSLRRQSLPVGAFYDRRTLLGDRDPRRVGVGRGDRRHHRGVDDPQPIEPMRTHSSTPATVMQDQLVG